MTSRVRSHVRTCLVKHLPQDLANVVVGLALDLAENGQFRAGMFCTAGPHCFYLRPQHVAVWFPNGVKAKDLGHMFEGRNPSLVLKGWKPVSETYVQTFVWGSFQKSEMWLETPEPNRRFIAIDKWVWPLLQDEIHQMPVTEKKGRNRAKAKDRFHFVVELFDWTKSLPQ